MKQVSLLQMNKLTNSQIITVIAISAISIIAVAV